MTLSSAWRRPSNDGVARARERVGQVGRLVDALGMGALRARQLVVSRRRIEIGEPAAVVLAGGAVLEHRHRGAAYRGVAAVVEHDGEDRQFVFARDPVANGRIAEHVGAVAQRGDDELLGRRQLGAERGAEAPAQPAGGAEREQRARLLARAMVRPQRVFVENDGVLARALRRWRARDIPAKCAQPERNPWRVARGACACARSAARGGRQCALPPFAGAARPPRPAPPARWSTPACMARSLGNERIG